MLKETFIGLLNNYTDNECLANELWTEIENNYSNKERHYHTLQHLGNLLGQLTKIKNEILNWDAVLFTMYYHDVIYDPLQSDNEEKSAELAEKRMKHITVPNSIIQLCRSQILATKSHIESDDSDTNYFTDADLSVLGQPWEIYLQYSQNVRKEYSIYPDFIYNSGRKKVLTHFLTMERIFKTDFFYDRFEMQAKHNLTHELNTL